MEIILIIPLLMLLIIGIVIWKKRKNNSQARYYTEEADTTTILLPPSRFMVFGSGFFLIGIMLTTLFGSLVYDKKGNNFIDKLNYFPLVFFCIGIIVLVGSIKFLFKGSIVQFRMTKQGLYYRGDIAWEPSRGTRTGGEKMFFGRQKFTFIEYSHIQYLEIERSLMFGDAIRIYKKEGRSFYLPFYFENQTQLSEVYEKLCNYVNGKRE